MTATTLDLCFGWAALLLGTFATAILFFAVNPAFGRVLMLPVAVAMALLSSSTQGVFHAY
jgi:hypothetical protein